MGEAATASSERGVRVRGLRFTYPGGGFRLDVRALDVPGGTTAALVGPSGAGKTTLLHVLAGILPAQEGSVRVAGTELAGAPDRARRAFRVRRVGLVFQEFELLDHLTVRENALLPYLVSDALLLDADVDARLSCLADGCGIGHLLDRRPRALSQGERQRVAICRALVPEPAVVLADEPTGNLDPSTAAQVLALLLERTRSVDATLIMVTHDHGLLPGFQQVIDLAARAPEAGP